jgi:tetratricopeptide (TPR) repeat protein
MNPSIFAILITSIIIFISQLLIGYLPKWRYTFICTIVIYLMGMLLLYFLLQGRAAVIGAGASLLYIMYTYKKQCKLPKKVLLKMVLLMSIVLVVAIYIKKDSSHGRLLVYKVVATQLTAKDYIFGLGLGKFKAQYNILQAQYFAQNGMYSKEALLAGNGYYMYNDWLQAALEIGWMGMAILGVIIILFFKLYSWQPSTKPILIAANTALVCISVAALFSYPLQEPLIFLFFILCIVIHFYYSYTLQKQYRFRLFILSKNVLLVSITVLSLFYSCIIWEYKQHAQLAYTYIRDGFKNEADTIFTQLATQPFADYNTHYNYAYTLYFKNELPKALQQIDKALSMVYSMEAVKLKADILYEQNQIATAEVYYKQAVYMIPNRILPKMDLLKFYMKTRQYTKAKYWAKTICTMPIKVPSTTVDKIKMEAEKLLETMQQDIVSVTKTTFIYKDRVAIAQIYSL